MQGDPVADDARVDNVVLHDAENAQEDGHRDGVLHREEPGNEYHDQRHGERSNQGNEFQQARHQTQHEGVVHADK